MTTLFANETKEREGIIVHECFMPATSDQNLRTLIALPEYSHLLDKLRSFKQRDSAFERAGNYILHIPYDPENSYYSMNIMEVTNFDAVLDYYNLMTSYGWDKEQMKHVLHLAHQTVSEDSPLFEVRIQDARESMH